MKYLKNSFSLVLVLLAMCSAFCQSQNEVSNLKDFSGIWKFIPIAGSEDTIFENHYIIGSNVLLSVTLWKDSRNLYALGPYIIGFFNGDEIIRLSDLQSKGTRMYFFEKYPNAPNDSIKYYREAIASCFASYNGTGTDEYEQPQKGQPNYLLFNYNGRDYEGWDQCTHLPNYIVQSLLKQNRKDWQKVRELLPHDYKIVRVPKTTIYSQPNVLTRMYLLKDDVVEVTEEKGEWLQIKYYIEKKNKDTGRTIEGWIKKSDVE